MLTPCIGVKRDSISEKSSNVLIEFPQHIVINHLKENHAIYKKSNKILKRYKYLCEVMYNYLTFKRGIQNNGGPSNFLEAFNELKELNNNERKHSIAQAIENFVQTLILIIATITELLKMLFTNRSSYSLFSHAEKLQLMENYCKQISAFYK